MSSDTIGVVFKSTGSWYNVQLESGEFLQCRTRGKLKLSQVKTTNPVAVGDKVNIVPDSHHPGTGIITDILPRENFVIRKSVHKTEHGHLLAANIDQAVIMVTISHPKTSFGFIDRFLVSTDAYRIPSIILINKTDLHDAHDHDLMESLIDTYEMIGVRCFPISIKENNGLSVLDKLLKNKLTLFAGHSGTGKSTLMNKLHIDIDQKIGRVSEFANKGIHTTTFAEMFQVSENTYVIDTPGIKELGLIDIGDHELSDYFPEMRALLGECKFNNCSHTHEPKCSIIDAVEAGRIAMSRFNSYLSMLENEDTRR